MSAVSPARPAVPSAVPARLGVRARPAPGVAPSPPPPAAAAVGRTRRSASSSRPATRRATSRSCCPRIAAVRPAVHEIIVVDGNSTDGSIDVARRVLPSVQGDHPDPQGQGQRDGLRVRRRHRRRHRHVRRRRLGRPGRDPRLRRGAGRGRRLRQGLAASPPAAAATTSPCCAAPATRASTASPTRCSAPATPTSATATTPSGPTCSRCSTCPTRRRPRARGRHAVGRRLRDRDGAQLPRSPRPACKITEVPSVERQRMFGETNLRTFADGTRVLRTLWPSTGGPTAGRRPAGPDPGPPPPRGGSPVTSPAAPTATVVDLRLHRASGGTTSSRPWSPSRRRTSRPLEMLVVVDHNPALLDRARADVRRPGVRVLPNAHAPGPVRRPQHRRRRGDRRRRGVPRRRRRGPPGLARRAARALRATPTSSPSAASRTRAVPGPTRPRPCCPAGGPARRRHRRARLDRRLHLHRPAHGSRPRCATSWAATCRCAATVFAARRRLRRGPRPHRAQPAGLRGDRALHPRPAGLPARRPARRGSCSSRARAGRPPGERRPRASGPTCGAAAGRRACRRRRCRGWSAATTRCPPSAPTSRRCCPRAVLRELRAGRPASAGGGRRRAGLRPPRATCAAGCPARRPACGCPPPTPGVRSARRPARP